MRVEDIIDRLDDDELHKAGCQRISAEAWGRVMMMIVDMQAILEGLEFEPAPEGDDGYLLAMGRNGLLTPGAVVKLEDGTVWLVGHINVTGGFCECCVDADRIVGIAHISQAMKGR